MRKLLIATAITFMGLASPAIAQNQTCNPYTDNTGSIYNSYSRIVDGWCLQFYTKNSTRSYMQYATASIFTPDNYLVVIAKGWGENGLIGYSMSTSYQGSTLFSFLTDPNGNIEEGSIDGYTDAISQFMPDLLTGIRVLNRYPFPVRGNPFIR